MVLTCFHHNSVGLDEFLGQVTLPLNEMDTYKGPRSKWCTLQSKPGKEKKNKERGELEVRIAFTVRAGSLSDLSKKEKTKSSISNIASSVGGSLLSIGTIEKRKNLKKFATSLGSKMHITGKKKKEKVEDTDSYSGSFSSVSTPRLSNANSRQTYGDADPGVVSEDDDDFPLDNLSQKSSGSSLNLRSHSNQFVTVDNSPREDFSRKFTSTPPSKPPRTVTETFNESSEKVDEWEQKLYKNDYGNSDTLKRRSWESSRVPLKTQIEENENEDKESQLQQIDLKSESETPTTVSSKSNSSNSVTSPQFVSNTIYSYEAPEKPQNDRPVPLPRSPALLDKRQLKQSQDNLSNSGKPDKVEKESILSKLKYLRKDKRAESYEDLKSLKNGGRFSSERIIVGGENDLAMRNMKNFEISKEILQKYDGKSREEVMKIAYNLENEVFVQKQKVKELEDYLDSLLLRVMESHPRILQNPYSKANTKR